MKTVAEVSAVKRITFKSREITVSGVLHLPDDFNEAKSYAVLVLTTPGSSVKEQIGAVYAERLAKQGFIALVFDPSFQGESGGEPRDLEDPAVRVEDIHAAVDFLTTLSFVDTNRIGLLGICAGGGYAIAAAKVDHRFKAVGTVVGGNIGAAFRRFMQQEGIQKTLEAVGQARTNEARSGEQRRDPWIPDTLNEAKAHGVTDPELLEAVYFYRESKYKHPNSTNRILFKSLGYILNFDAFNLVPELLTQPLQVIVGGKRGNTGQYEDGEKLFGLSPASDKHFFVVEGASHYDMYFKPEYVGPAVDCLVQFYSKHL